MEFSIIWILNFKMIRRCRKIGSLNIRIRIDDQKMFEGKNFSSIERSSFFLGFI